MRELRRYAEPALKIFCLILAGFVVWQLAGIFIRWNPFRGVTVPELPSLAASTNSPAGGGRGTNVAASVSVAGTNNTLHLTGTNTLLSGAGAMTNTASPTMPTEMGTNVVIKSATNPSETNSTPAMAAADLGTNHLVPMATAGTNNATSGMSTNTSSVLTVLPAENAADSTNRSLVRVDTNAVANRAIRLVDTNSTLATNLADAGTNIASRPQPKMAGPNSTLTPPVAGMNLNQPPGIRGPDLSPAMQTRVSKIVDSEILGPVMHPLPMALLGIAGDVAFLRSASGQTGLVKAGDSLADLKLLKIGINRVLIERNGQKEELMIFSGYGGDSLLPTQKDTPDENKHP